MDEDVWFKEDKDKKISKQFSIENETLYKVEEFMKNYGRENFTKSISDLVYLGLANLGYTDKQKAKERFKFKGLIPAIDYTYLPKEDSDIVVYNIIKTLSQKSIERNAHRTQILLESRAKDISSGKTTEILDNLKDSMSM